MKKKISKMIYYKDGSSHFECKKCGITSDGGTVCDHFIKGDVEVIGIENAPGVKHETR